MGLHVLVRVGLFAMGGIAAGLLAKHALWKIENERILRDAHRAMDEGRFADAHALLMQLEERLMAASGEQPMQA